MSDQKTVKDPYRFDPPVLRFAMEDSFTQRATAGAARTAAMLLRMLTQVGGDRVDDDIDAYETAARRLEEHADLMDPPVTIETLQAEIVKLKLELSKANYAALRRQGE